MPARSVVLNMAGRWLTRIRKYPGFSTFAVFAYKRFFTVVVALIGLNNLWNSPFFAICG